MENDPQRILDAIAALPAKQLRQRVSAAIAAEYNKPAAEVDADYLNACEDFLIALDGKPIPESHETERRQRLLNDMARRSGRAKILKRAAAASLGAAAVLALLVVSDGALHWTGLIGRSVNHEQQYNIGGLEMDPALVERGHADDAALVSRISTDDFEEAVAVLGFTPAMPELPDWRTATYTVEHTQTCAHMVTLYQRGAERLYYFVEGFDKTVEMDAVLPSAVKGEKQTLGGVDYWLDESDGQASCLWTNEYAVYQLSGALSQQELLSIAQTVKPGDETSGFTGGAQISTQDFEKAVGVLGYEPETPTYLPANLSLYEYHAFVSSFSQSFLASYTIPGTDEILHYSVDRYSSAEDATAGGGYEQNCEGRTVQEQGVSYYIAYNYERPFIVWTDGLIGYSVSGPIAEEELLRMAVSVSGGDPMHVALGTVRHPVALVTDEEAIRIATADLEAKYSVSLSGLHVSVYHARISETRSEITVQFRIEENSMWKYAARVDAQTGEVLASIDDVSWEPFSGGLLQPIGYDTDSD